MSQVSSAGCPRELEEPVSISTVSGGIAASLAGPGAFAVLLGCGQDRDGPLGVEGKLL